LHDDFAVSGAVVEVEEYDLLPGAKQELALGEGDGEAGFQERGSDMGKAVAVVPFLVVLVIIVFRDQLPDGPFQVGDRALLVFQGGDARSGPGNEYGCDPVLNSGLHDGLVDLVGYVYDVAIAAGLNLKTLARYRHFKKASFNDLRPRRK